MHQHVNADHVEDVAAPFGIGLHPLGRRLLEAQARFRLAQAYIRMGLRERAVEHLQVATERGGSSEWAERSRDYLQVIE